MTSSDHFHRGTIESFEGHAEDAARHYREAIRLQPAELVAYIDLAYNLSLRGNHTEALAILDQAERIHPANPGVAATRAWVQVRSGRIAEGESVLRELIARHPVEPRAVQFLDAHLQQQGRFDDLLAMYDELCEREPTTQRRCGLAAARVLTGELETASAEVDELLACEPNHRFAKALRAVIDLHLGEIDRATDGLRALADDDALPVVLETIHHLCAPLQKKPGAERYQRFFQILTVLCQRTQ